MVLSRGINHRKQLLCIYAESCVFARVLPQALQVVCARAEINELAIVSTCNRTGVLWYC